MKTLLTNRQNKDQKNANEFNKRQFILLMMNMDTLYIDTILNDSVVYMENMSKQQFIFWLRKKFEKIDPFNFFSSYKEKISVDQYPGADVIEFTYITCKNEDDELDVKNTKIDLNDVEFRRKHNVYKLKFVLSFKNGQITDIMIPKKTISIKSAEKFAELN
jgi:hypothetical protein